MKHLRLYIRRILSEQVSKYPEVEEHPLMKELIPRATQAYTSYDGTILKFMQSDGCAALLDIRLSEDPSRPDALYIEQLEVLKYPYGELDYECFGKGYAKEVLTLLAKTADQTGTELDLVAVPTASGKERAYFNLPDKDQLASLYAKYGFEETGRNFAQVLMTRKPNQR